MAKTQRPKAKERGSALLVSLMILVGLTLLGLAFVAVTQTESAISVTQKNYTQTLQVAEAGALRAVDWFQNPDWAERQGLLPPNRNEIKVLRTLTNVTPTYAGRYKDASGDVMFDKPFRTAEARHRFYGTETNPDIWINETTSEATQAAMSAANDFLTLFNIRLFNNNTALATMDNNEGGVITDIRVYGPPVENAAINGEAGWTGTASGTGVNATGFIEGGTRYGIATVRVTATKFDPACTAFPCTSANRRVVSTRTVKVTIAEWPFPGPQGPVQTNANLNTTGNIQVHWGKTTANGNMTMAKTFAGIPWADAWDQVHWEHGYDPGTFPLAFTSDWPHVATASVKDTKNYLYEIVGQAYPDPWWEMRARGSLNIKGVTDPTPYDFAIGIEPDDSTANRSNWFQSQDQNLRPDRQNVLFPRIDYNFWKQLALTADDEPNIYYLRWVNTGGGDVFQDKFGRQRTFRQWVDITSNPPAGTGPKSVPGFYFFDTKNQANPQNGQGGQLTPAIDVKGGSMQAKGFIYVNTLSFGTQGLGGVNEWVNMPGEPYRDIGYLQVQETSTSPDYKGFQRIDSAGAACIPATGINCVPFGANNNIWDFQDVPWSHTGAGENNIFDFRVQQVATADNDGGDLPADAKWFIMPYTAGCNPGVNCSEPHEPYLNLVYPTTPTANTIAAWYNPASLNANLADAKSSVATRRPKITSGGTPVTCVAESTVSPTADVKAYKADRDNCTSNAWDADGGLVQLENSFNGVFYTEGMFDATGSAVYFGSVLAEGNAEKAGNPDIYFDERLVKGAWPPGNFGFPRVYITSEQTDQ